MDGRLALTLFAPGLDMLPADATAAAGGKGASLARMTAAGLPVPPGFVVCTNAFQTFLEHCGADTAIAGLAETLDVADEEPLAGGAGRIRTLIPGNPIPAVIEEAIRQGYASLGANRAVAVRSSAVGEDSETAS